MAVACCHALLIRMHPSPVITTCLLQMLVWTLFTFLLPHDCPVTNVFVLLPVVTLVSVLWCFKYLKCYFKIRYFYTSKRFARIVHEAPFYPDALMQQPTGCFQVLVFLSVHRIEETNWDNQASVSSTGNKLRRLMMFAWPCLLVKNCVDPATRYHGHLLLSHIIAKFAIHKRIVLQGEYI